MYGIYIYANIGGILMVNVTIYSIHGSYGILMGSFRSAMLCEQSGQDKDYIEHVKKRAREHKFKFKGHNMIYMILHVYYLGGSSEMGVRNCTRKFLTATHLGRQIAQRRLQLVAEHIW